MQNDLRFVGPDNSDVSAEVEEFNDDKMDVLELTRALIDIPSITGGEASIAEFIESHCKERGWLCEREHLSGGRWNLWINWMERVPVAFCTHMDTVPPHIQSGCDDDFVYGRGACDTKGIIAAMLCAGDLLAEKGVPPSYLFVVGEETGSEGAKLAALSSRRCGYIVVGEPTNNMMAAGHKGACSYTLRVTGKAAHSALPEKGSSAVERLIDLLLEIKRLEWERHGVLGGTTTSITMISGGTAINIIPANAEAKVFHRITVPLDEAVEKIRGVVGERGELTFHSQTNPQLMEKVDGFETTVVSYGTDVPYVRALGRPLLFGPGSIEDAHTPQEKISIQQLHDSIGLYIRLHETLRNKDAGNG
jgi:acetylornithine deacetylase